MEKAKIVALGDSITKGVILGEDNNYFISDGSFVELIRREMGCKIENYGRFGCTINYGHQLLDRHAEEIAKAEYTVIEYGGNDCDFYWKRIALNPSGDHHPKTTLNDFRTSLVRLIERVRVLGSKPLILSLPPIISDSYFDFFSRGMTSEQRASILSWMGGEVEAIARWHESYNKVLFEVAEQTATPIIDITRPFTTCTEGWRSLICPDGIHPNSAGHRLIANSILSAVG
ncbi:MAG: SGNH/GDSL hydrolase family protein [Tidjanibacter sp.]|nr:SGNH/GDSL hydrolase family protein [Tidjanibacter sp.]